VRRGARAHHRAARFGFSPVTVCSRGHGIGHQGNAPSSPHPDWFLEATGWATYALGDYDKALAAFQEYHKRNPGDTDGYVEIIYTSATLGQLDKAKAKVAALLGKNPDFSIEGYSMMSKFKDPAVAKLIATTLPRRDCRSEADGEALGQAAPSLGIAGYPGRSACAPAFFLPEATRRSEPRRRFPYLLLAAASANS
jgi:tetratricopeptide (TPR) repeat protein